MPRAAAICPQHGCPNPKPCPLHTPKPWAGRLSASARGYGHDWTKRRQRILTRDRHTCYLCGRPADQVDHVTPRAEAGSDADTNLAAICSPCHQDKTLTEARRGRRRAGN